MSDDETYEILSFGEHVGAMNERERIVAMLRNPDFDLTMMVCEKCANIGGPMPERYAARLLGALADHIEAEVKQP